MYGITLNANFQEVGIFQLKARRQYRTQRDITAAFDGRVKLQRIGKRDEWRLLLGNDRREIGRATIAPIITPPPTVHRPRFRDAVKAAVQVAHALLMAIF
jgi:hypothetical protein